MPTGGIASGIFGGALLLFCGVLGTILALSSENNPDNYIPLGVLAVLCFLGGIAVLRFYHRRGYI